MKTIACRTFCSDAAAAPRAWERAPSGIQPVRKTMKLKGKTVLITGGGSGLGREMGLLFASEGAKIGVNDIRSESAHNVATEIERAGGTARPLVADVSNSA